MTRNAYIAIHLVPVALLIVAIGPLPYGYYTLLRIAVCVAAAWLAVLDYQRDENVGPWVIALGLGAILFNPIIPIHLDRDIWFILDIGMAGVLAAHLMVTKSKFHGA